MIWDRLRQHSPVYDGDTIRTAAESEATIYFEDGNIMELGENTMAQVFFHDGQVETSVSGGLFVVNSSNAKNGALVKTGSSSVVVSAGSSISATVSEAAGTRVNVASGEAVFTDENGAVYHHILDPAAGIPADSDLASATIVSKSGAEADALSTASYILGLEKASSLWRQSEGSYDMVLITDDGTVYVTEPLSGLFTTKLPMKVIS